MIDYRGSTVNHAPVVIQMQHNQNQESFAGRSEGEPTEAERYSSYQGNGKTVIYDQENATAWIQSDIAVEISR